jgi:hypothetical protein
MGLLGSEPMELSMRKKTKRGERMYSGSKMFCACKTFVDKFLLECCKCSLISVAKDAEARAQDDLVIGRERDPADSFISRKFAKMQHCQVRAIYPASYLVVVPDCAFQLAFEIL